MNPIPLVTASELRPLHHVLTTEDRALIERWCEINKRWIDAGTATAPVMTADVRGLLQMTVRLAREYLTHEAAQQARAAMVTIPAIGSNEEGGP